MAEKILTRNVPHQRNLAFCKRAAGEAIVQAGLALRPSDIERLARDGIAVSTPAASNFYHEQDSVGWQVDPVFQRDSDRNSMWEASHVSRSRIMAAKRRDHENFT